VISTADAIAAGIRHQRYDSFTSQEGTSGGQHLAPAAGWATWVSTAHVRSINTNG